MKTKHVFNLTLLCSALVLSGCGGGKSSSGTENQKLEPYLEASMARATTQTMTLQGPDAKVPLSNNLLMDAKTGSLKIPTGGNDDISNPKAALNYAEGFSTTMPIYIEFSGDLDNSSAAGAVEVVSSVGVPFNDISINVLGNQLIIKPTKPFQNDTQYLLVVTDDLLDAQGDRVGISRSYAHLKSSKTNYKGSVLESAKSLIQDQEKLAGALGIDTTKIVYSASFKTASVGKVLTNTATLLAGSPTERASAWSGSRNPNDVNLGDAYRFTLEANPDFTESFKKAFGEESLTFYLGALFDSKGIRKEELNTTIKVTTGKVTLPYFLEDNLLSFRSVPFEPAVAKGKAVTHYPKIKSLQEVPFVLYSPANPDGIVIYQHGITTRKETAASFAYSLTSANLAVIAIDHPLHGERQIREDKVKFIPADDYLNLEALPVARDNMRQSVLDIIGLRIALNNLSVLNDTAKDDVKFLGHSMGGIVGIPAVSIAQNLTSDPNKNINLGFTSAVYSSAGGHIAELLFASEKFGPFTKHKLLMEMSPAYKNSAERCSIDSTPDEACLYNFEAALSPQKKLEIEEDLERFKVAAQTLVDVVDPYSFLGSSYKSGALSVPTMTVQIKGDKVVPNGDGTKSYGTAKLNDMFDKGTTSTFEPKEFSGAAENSAHHSSLLGPNPEFKTAGDIGASNDVTQEVQAAVVGFLAKP